MGMPVPTRCLPTDHETDVFQLIKTLCDHIASQNYRGPSLLQVLRRPQDACPADLPPLDRQAYTVLRLCQPPPGMPLRSVRLEDLDITAAVDHFIDVARDEQLGLEPTAPVACVSLPSTSATRPSHT